VAEALAALYQRLDLVPGDGGQRVISDI